MLKDQISNAILDDDREPWLEDVVEQPQKPHAVGAETLFGGAHSEYEHGFVWKLDLLRLL